MMPTMRCIAVSFPRQAVPEQEAVGVPTTTVADEGQDAALGGKGYKCAAGFYH